MGKEFRQAYAQLNSEQKKAVEAIEGPLLIVAGPGTGKTELLSARVANILQKTDSEPFNILALTFTNKAAVNMRQRIIKLAGSEGARVQVRTFHSFAGEIMNLYPDHFWNSARLSVAPVPVQLDIIEAIIKQLPLDNPLAMKFAGQYTLVGEIQRSINLTKEAGLTPDKLEAIVRGNLAYIDQIDEDFALIAGQALSHKKLSGLVSAVASLPEMKIDKSVYPLLSLPTVIAESLQKAVEVDHGSGKTVETGRWKRRWVQNESGEIGMHTERRRNQWWLNLSSVYRQYRDELHSRGFFDYADMLVEVISQLEKKPEVRADVQERFSYVLIDEFQDTNPAQLRLAHLVSDHPALNGKPNLMAVGDDDQSIFKFNGAELNNMLGFKRAYPSAKTLVLTKNYRSSDSILELGQKIISQAETRLIKLDKSLNKRLRACNPPKGTSKVKALSYRSRELQLSEVARRISSSYSKDRQVAVLARGHDSLIRMSGILQQLGVPIRYEQASDVLKHEVVEQVYLVCKLLEAINNGDKKSSDILIHQIIRHPLWGIKPKQLWDLAKLNYPKGDWLESLLSSRQTQIRQIGEWFVWLAQQSTAQPLAVSLEQILGLSGSKSFTSPMSSFFASGTLRGTNDYFYSLSAIQLLRSTVHEFTGGAKPKLGELIRFIDVNRQNNVVVADESPFITGKNAVQLLTVHKAKGLEFDDVYIIDAVEDNWQPKAGGRKPPANLSLQPVGDDFDDYVRLMYVAATRARANVTISAYFQDHAGKDIAESSIVASAIDINRVGEASRKRLIEVLEQSLQWPDLGKGSEKEILRARLETYSLSVTHLLNFLDLTKGGPQYFKERNLLRLPEVKTSSLSYGTAAHRALGVAQRQVNGGKFSLKGLLNEFDEALLAEQMPAAEFKRFSKQGKRMLSRLFNDFGYCLPESSVSEQKISELKLEHAVLNGQLDRVDTDGEHLRIVDYKTGRPLNSLSTQDKPKAVKAYKHRTQLVFYALLAREHPSLAKHTRIEGQMVYIDSEDARHLVLTYVPTKEDIERLRSLVNVVWEKIVKVELPDISDYSADIDGILAFEADLIKTKTRRKQ